MRGASKAAALSGDGLETGSGARVETLWHPASSRNARAATVLIPQSPKNLRFGARATPIQSQAPLALAGWLIRRVGARQPSRPQAARERCLKTSHPNAPPQLGFITCGSEGTNQKPAGFLCQIRAAIIARN